MGMGLCLHTDRQRVTDRDNSHQPPIESITMTFEKATGNETENDEHHGITHILQQEQQCKRYRDILQCGRSPQTLRYIRCPLRTLAALGRDLEQ
jgi:hypothetical protein